MNLDALRKLRETDATRTFSFPHELIDDPSLNASQKRELLAEWASDACAIESFPTLRLLPGTTFPVTLSAIMDALAKLDGASAMEVDKQERSAHKSAAKRRKNHPHFPVGRGRHSSTANHAHAGY